MRGNKGGLGSLASFAATRGRAEVDGHAGEGITKTANNTVIEGNDDKWIGWSRINPARENGGLGLGEKIKT